MAKKRKPTKFLNLKLIEKFLRDYQHMPYKAKSAIMAAILVILLIPLAVIFPLNPSRSPLDLSPLNPADQPSCYITGCADHLCLDTPIDTPPTTCQILPEFQCLQHSVCELQNSGHCGWTPTPAYLNCLKNIYPQR